MSMSYDSDPVRMPDSEWVRDGFPSEREFQDVERWIEREGLNSFGDPAETMYAGGDPLFYSGKTRYQYLMENHPDAPWARGDGPMRAG